MKLIKLNTDHYVVVADSEIKEGDWCEDNGTIFNIKDKNHLLTVLNCGSPVKITHSTQPIEIIHTSGVTMTNPPMGYINIIELPLSEVKELLGEVDAEKKAEEVFPIISGAHPNINWDRANLQEGFVTGYTQALADNKAKKYTEEDLKRYHNIMCLHGNKKGEEFIQSLQPKTEWEVEFIDGKLKLK